MVPRHRQVAPRLPRRDTGALRLGSPERDARPYGSSRPLRAAWALAVIVLTIAACSRNTTQARARGGTAAAGRQVIQNKGSDTLVNVAQAWAETYAILEPHVSVAVSGGGSGVGLSALIQGTVDLANSSRIIKERERSLAQQHGVAPLEFTVGYDALAIFVHHENPLKSLTIEQLREIYGEGGPLLRWSQLGISLPRCPSDQIVVISRQNNSGTYAYFKEAVLAKGEFRLGTRDLHGSKDVADLVAGTPCAIGYSGLAYVTKEVSVPCLVNRTTNECVYPSVETALDRTYPIARPLLMYTNGPPTGALKTYLDWILSDAGQCIIKAKGYAAFRPVTCG